MSMPWRVHLVNELGSIFVLVFMYGLGDDVRRGGGLRVLSSCTTFDRLEYQVHCMHEHV